MVLGDYFFMKGDFNLFNDSLIVAPALISLEDLLH